MNQPNNPHTVGVPVRIREARLRRNRPADGLPPKPRMDPRVLSCPWHVVSRDGVLLAGALYEEVARRVARVLGARVLARRAA